MLEHSIRLNSLNSIANQNIKTTAEQNIIKGIFDFQQNIYVLASKTQQVSSGLEKKISEINDLYVNESDDIKKQLLKELQQNEYPSYKPN